MPGNGGRVMDAEYLGVSCIKVGRRQWHPTPVLLSGKEEEEEEPGRLQSHGVAESQTRLSDFPFTLCFHALEKEMATHSRVLAWRIPGMGEPGGLPLWGHTESDRTEATQQQQHRSKECD